MNSNVKDNLMKKNNIPPDQQFGASGWHQYSPLSTGQKLISSSQKLQVFVSSQNKNIWPCPIFVIIFHTQEFWLKYFYITFNCRETNRHEPRKERNQQFLYLHNNLRQLRNCAFNTNSKLFSGEFHQICHMQFETILGLSIRTLLIC